MKLYMAIFFLTLLLGGCGDGMDTAEKVVRGWGDPVTLEGVSGDVSDLQTAFSAEGLGAAAWICEEDGSRSIRAALFDGQDWGAATRLDGAAAEVSEPRVDVNAAGRAVVLWHEAAGGNERVMARVFDGASWSAPASLTACDHEICHLRVAVDGAGRAVAVWEQNRDFSFSVHASRFDGENWGAAQQFEVDGENLRYPEVVMNPAGRAMVMFVVGRRPLKVCSRMLADGVWQDAGTVSHDGFLLNSGVGLQAGMDDAGRVMLVFDVSGEFYVERFDGASWGSSWSQEDYGSLVRDVNLVVNSSGQAAVSWQCLEGGRTDIRVRRFDGETWSGAEAVTSGGVYNALSPRLAMDGSGRTAVFWQQQDGLYNGIWSNMFDGRHWEGALQVERCAGSALSPRAGFDALGRPVALWRQAEGVRFNLNAARRHPGRPGPPAGAPAVYPEREWTCMYYFAGDNNLSEQMLAAINRLEGAGADENINLVMQAEFSETHGLDELQLGSRACRGRLIQDDDFMERNFDFNISSMFEDIGRRDMTDPRELVDFIRWAVRTFPARRYVLVLNDHGDSWREMESMVTPRGILTDETDAPERMMSIPDLAWALETAGVHFELINFNACLMGAFEVAYELRDRADYVTFSEEITYGDNCEHVYLGALRNNPHMNAAELAETIVRSSRDAYAEWGYRSTVRSAVDLSGMERLKRALDGLGRVMSGHLETELANINNATANSVEYSSDGYAQRDLGEFLDRLSGLTADGEMLTAVHEAQAALAESVACNTIYVIDGGADDYLLPSQGLSIYLPDWNGLLDRMCGGYYSGTNWNLLFDHWLHQGAGLGDYGGLACAGTSSWKIFLSDLQRKVLVARLGDVTSSAAVRETDDNGNFSDCSLTMNGAGRAVAVWCQAGDASRYNVYARTYGESGWGGTRLLEGFDEFAYAPRAGMDAAGNVLAVFARRVGEGGAIMVNRFDGAAWGGEQPLHDDGDFAFSPELAMNASGRAVVVWREVEEGFVNLYARMYDGAAWGAVVPLESSADPVWNPRVVMDDAGRVVTCWRQGFERQAWVSRFDGAAWGAPLLLAGATGCGDDDVHVFLDADGLGVAVWKRGDDVRCRSFDGGGWGAQMSLGGGEALSCLEVAADGGGRAVAAWVDGKDVQERKLRVRRFDGADWSGAEIFAYEGDHCAPQVAAAVNAAGQVMLVYDVFDESIWSTVCRSRYFDGEDWSVAEPGKDLPGSQSHPLAAMDDAGRALALWNGSPDWSREILHAGRFDGAAWEAPAEICGNK